MNAVAQVSAVIAALVHIVVWPLESLFFRRPAVHRKFLKTPTEHVPAVMLWAFNMGFRNLYLGIGVIVGLVLVWTGDVTVGRTLVIYTCAYMAVAGLTMGVSDGLGYYQRKGDGIAGTIGAAGPPLVAVVAALL